MRGRDLYLKHAVWWPKLAEVWLKSHRTRMISFLGSLCFIEENRERERANIVGVVVPSSPSFASIWVCSCVDRGEEERMAARERESELRERVNSGEGRENEGK